MSDSDKKQSRELETKKDDERHPTQGTVGKVSTSFLSGLRYRSDAKALDAYRQLLYARNNVASADMGLGKTLHEHERVMRLLRNSEDVHEKDAEDRRTALRRSKAEAAEALDKQEEAEFQLEMKRIERARKLAEARGEVPPRKEDTEEKRQPQSEDEAEAMREMAMVLIDKIVNDAGGEENLSEADLNKIQSIIDGLDEALRDSGFA